MVSLADVHVGPQERQGDLPVRPHGRERLLHGAEHLHNASERALPLVDDARAWARGKLGADHDRTVVRDVLHNPESFHPSPVRLAQRNAVLYINIAKSVKISCESRYKKAE